MTVSYQRLIIILISQVLVKTDYSMVFQEIIDLGCYTLYQS